MDDDALPGGNPGGVEDDWIDGDLVNTTGTISPNYDTAGPAIIDPISLVGAVLPSADFRISPATTIPGLTLTIQQEQSGTWVDVIQVSLFNLTAEGSIEYSVTQVHAINHVLGFDENNIPAKGSADEFAVNVQITNRYGESSESQIKINVDDDTPNAPTVILSEVEPIALTFDGGLVDGNFVGTEGAGDTNVSSVIAEVDFAGAFVIGNQDDFGADGGGATTVDYALKLADSYTEGDPSGLTSGGTPVRLYEAGGVITGSTAASEGAVDGTNTIFKLELTGSVVKLIQSKAVDHSQSDTYNGAYISDLAILASGLVELQASAYTTDSEGDTTNTVSAILDLGGNVQFGDDGPHIVTAPVQDMNPTLGMTLWTYTGAFAYLIGADQHGPTYSALDSDFAGLTLSGTANDELIAAPVVSWNSEDDNSATFDVSFNYDQDRNPATAPVPVTGSLVFDKVADTYTFEMDALQVLLDVTLGQGTGYDTYNVGGTTPSNGPSPVATGKLGEGFFIQITGFESPLNAGGDTAVMPGELVSGTQAPVTLSSVALGVSGNTIQSGEAANVNFFQTDPKGNLGATDFNLVTDFFIKFDGYETESDDLILILNLVDADNPSISTTRAMYVDQFDVYESDTNNADIVGTKYESIVGALDNNDGLLVVEGNDYNILPDDNWMLKGLQILSNDSGLTGNAINLNRDVGLDGGSSTAASAVSGLVGPGNTIQEDDSTNPIKIIDAGFTSVSTVPPTLNLELMFNVVDADGDSTPVQTIDLESPVVADLVGSTSLLAMDVVL